MLVSWYTKNIKYDISTEPLSPKCELAISLSSWNLMAEEIFSDGFILYSLSSSKFEVAVFDDEKIFTTSLTTFGGLLPVLIFSVLYQPLALQTLIIHKEIL